MRTEHVWSFRYKGDRYTYSHMRGNAEDSMTRFISRLTSNALILGATQADIDKADYNIVVLRDPYERIASIVDSNHSFALVMTEQRTQSEVLFPTLYNRVTTIDRMGSAMRRMFPDAHFGVEFSVNDYVKPLGAGQKKLVWDQYEDDFDLLNRFHAAAGDDPWAELNLG